MEILRNIDLYKFSTMRLHSVADIMYIPENVTELSELISQFKKRNQKFHIVANGSNIIFSDRVLTPIILIRELDDTISFLSDGTVKVGASVLISRLISALKKKNMGGIEYLSSVPSSLGGAIYMNAGRGEKIGKSISDFILKVEYMNIDTLEIEDYDGISGFSYRHSPFQDMNVIILSGTFNFISQSANITDKLIRERLEYSKKHLSAEKPSCGSVFCKANPILIRLLKGLKCGGAMYSSKTPNWISNNDNATASDIISLINIAKKLHKFFFCKIKQEVRIFR